MKGNQSPDRWPDLRLTCNPIYSRIAAIPASSRAHAIVQHRLRELASSGQVGQRRRHFSTQNHQCVAGWLDPTGSVGSPAPAAKGNALGSNLAVSQPSGQPPPEAGIARLIVMQPTQAPKQACRVLPVRQECPASKRGDPASLSLTRRGLPGTTIKLRSGEQT